MTDPKSLIKLIVLYLLDKVDFSLTQTEIYNFVLEKEYCNYFVLTQSIYELSEDAFIEARTTYNSTFLELTDKGRSTLTYFQNRISDGIRNDINTYYEQYKGDISNRMSIITNYYRTSRGDYIADLTAREKSVNLINIRINTPTEESAIAICEHWRDGSPDVYSFLLKRLL